MVSYLYRMPAGIPGSVTRLENFTGESEFVDATAAATNPLLYGYVMKTSAAGLMQKWIAGTDAATLIQGWLVRSYPGGASQDQLGVSTAPLGGVITRMKRGYMMVKMSLIAGPATAIKDGPVYIRNAAAGGGSLLGDIEGVSSANNVAVPGAFFVGPADSGGMTEIAYNI